MELRQLEYFQMASRLRNITRAAKRLRVSQPNITVAIKKLEAELGIQLFDRSQKQLSLTPEGTVFLSRVDVALRCLNDAMIEVNDFKQLQKGIIKIGIPPMMGAFLFPKIFSGFQALHPALDIMLFEEGSIAIRDLLDRDELDFGIVITSNASPTLNILPMTRQIMRMLPNLDGKDSHEKFVALEHYVTAKSGLERNRAFAVRDYRDKLLRKAGRTQAKANSLLKQADALQAEVDALMDADPENASNKKVEEEKVRAQAEKAQKEATNRSATRW